MIVAGDVGYYRALVGSFAVDDLYKHTNTNRALRWLLHGYRLSIVKKSGSNAISKATCSITDDEPGQYSSRKTSRHCPRHTIPNYDLVHFCGEQKQTACKTGHIKRVKKSPMHLNRFQKSRSHNNLPIRHAKRERTTMKQKTEKNELQEPVLR